MFKDITLGQFIPGNTIFHRLDSRIKLILCIIFMISIFYSTTFYQYAICVFVVILSILLAKAPFSMLRSGLKPVAGILAFTSILNILLTPGEILLEFWVIRITYDGLLLAVRMFIRMLLLVTETSLLAYTTTPIALADAVEGVLCPLKLLRIPVRNFGMMMSLSIRFVPIMMDELNKITNAQKARGAHFNEGTLRNRINSLLPIVIPLFVASFRRADELAIAIENRLYNSHKKRTRLHSAKLNVMDFIVLVLTILLLPLLYWIERIL